jgi:aryl-alcohol dehydrogenase-like predicted oxidoreductase
MALDSPTSFAPRTIGGKPVHPIGLGCMSLSHAYGVPPSRADGAKLLHRALDLGYNHLDTARIYGVGRNEELIGETLAGRRNEFFLASKTGIFVDGERRFIDCSPARMKAALDESLRLLKTDHIDLYYMHRRDFTVPIEVSVGALADEVKAGRIGAIGLSEMSAETLRKAAAVHPIAAVQTEYSPWTRQPEIAVLEACREVGTTFVAFSPVGRGALAMGVADPAELTEHDLRRSMPRFNAENWPANRDWLAAFTVIASESRVTPAQLALAWVLAKGEHIVAIPGTASIPHLEENWASRPLGADVIARVDQLIASRPVQGPRYPPALQRSIDTEDFA